MAFGASCHSSKEDIDELCAWFQSPEVGGRLPTASVAPMTSGGGWRLIAPQGGLRPGDVLLSVPLRSCIDSGRASLPTSEGAAKRDAAGPSPAWPAELISRLESWEDTDVLALRLVAERCAGSSSPWAPWIRSLPTSFDMPVFWSAKERELLAGTNVGALSDLMDKRLAQDWDSLVAPFVASLDAGSPLKGMTKADFVWAYGIIWSRAFGLGLGDGEKGGEAHTMKFVPLLDVANSLPPYGTGADVGSAGEACSSLDSCLGFGDEENETAGGGPSGGRRLVVRAAHAAAAGEEVFVSYGPYGDSKLLFSYGFCASGASGVGAGGAGDGSAAPSFFCNPWAQQDLWVHVQPSDEHAEAKMTALSRACDEQTYDFRGTLRARPPNAAAGLVVGAPNPPQVGISRELLATLRVIVARGPSETSAAALAQLSSPGAPPLNARNEEAALGALSATLRARLNPKAGQQQTTVASDRARILAELQANTATGGIGGGDVSHYRTALALTARLETKQLALAVVLVLDHAIAVLRSNPGSYSPPCLV